MASNMMNVMRSILFASMALAASSCGGSDAEETLAAHNTLSAAEVEAGWQLLFDGETTSGWNLSVWSVGCGV